MCCLSFQNLKEEVVEELEVAAVVVEVEGEEEGEGEEVLAAGLLQV